MHLAALCVFAALVLWFAQSPAVAQAASTIFLDAVADNTVYSESDSLSGGAGPHFWVGQTAGDGNRRALVRVGDGIAAPPSAEARPNRRLALPERCAGSP